MFLHDPTSSDVRNSSVLSELPTIYESINSDQFLAPDRTESYRKRQDPTIRFYVSDSMDPIRSGRIQPADIKGKHRKASESDGTKRPDPVIGVTQNLKPIRQDPTPPLRPGLKQKICTQIIRDV